MCAVPPSHYRPLWGTKQLHKQTLEPQFQLPILILVAMFLILDIIPNHTLVAWNELFFIEFQEKWRVYVPQG